MRDHRGAVEPFGGEEVLRFRRGVDRRRFLIGAAAVGVGGALVGGFGAPLAGAQPSNGDATDLEILEYALTLEYLEAEFYERGVQAGILSGRELELVAPIYEHEEAHVAALQAAISQSGSTPPPEPMFNFPSGTFGDRDTFLGQAQRFEEFGVAAYHGQVTAIDSPELLAAAAAIAGVESRHAAILSDLTGRRPFPSPFETPAPMSVILQAVSGLIAQEGS